MKKSMNTDSYAQTFDMFQGTLRTLARGLDDLAENDETARTAISPCSEKRLEAQEKKHDRRA